MDLQVSFMRWNHISKILTEEQQKSLNKLDWYLITVSREIDKVTSLFDRIKSFGGGYRKVTLKYSELISFKLKQSRLILMSIEENIFNSSFDLYKQHYGLFKNNLLEEREIKLSYEFENLLTQLKTILDLFLKYLGEICLNQKLGMKVNSFEAITRNFEGMKSNNKGNSEYRKTKNKLEIMRKEYLLKVIFKHFNTIYEIKNYRDYVIHHGNIVQDKCVSPKERYLEYSYRVPNLSKTKKGYKINQNFTRRLDDFCRLKFLEELYIINETLSRVIEPSQIKEIKKEFSKYKSKDVYEVLRFMGRKALFNDKSIIKEGELKKILKEKGLDFKNLVVEAVNTERVFEGHKSVDGKDMSYIQKRTFFKPLLGYLHINKLEHIYDRDWKPKNPLNPAYGIVDFSFGFESLNKKYKKIINSFVKLGLVIYLKEENKYILIDKDLERFIAILISLSQFKWTAINHPSFTYFRETNELEKRDLRKILGPKFKEELKKIDEEREKVDTKSEFYKLQKSWLEESEKKFLKLIKDNKEKHSKLIRKYDYLKPALKQINEDIFVKNPLFD